MTASRKPDFNKTIKVVSGPRPSTGRTCQGVAHGYHYMNRGFGHVVE